jgi:hypothetical protein
MTVGRVGVCILCTSVNEEGGCEKSADSEDRYLLSYTLRYVSLADLDRLCQLGFRGMRVFLFVINRETES